MKWKLNIKDWIKITIIKLLTNKYQNIIKSSSTKIEELFLFSSTSTSYINSNKKVA